MLSEQELKDLTREDLDAHIAALLSETDILCEIRDWAKINHKEHWVIEITNLFKNM